MAENEQKPNSVPSDGTNAESSNQAEETTSSQHFGNAVLAADCQDEDPNDLYYKYAVVYPSLKKLGYFSAKSFSISK